MLGSMNSPFPTSRTFPGPGFCRAVTKALYDRVPVGRQMEDPVDHCGGLPTSPFAQHREGNGQTGRRVDQVAVGVLRGELRGQRVAELSVAGANATEVEVRRRPGHHDVRRGEGLAGGLRLARRIWWSRCHTPVAPDPGPRERPPSDASSDFLTWSDLPPVRRAERPSGSRRRGRGRGQPVGVGWRELGRRWVRGGGPVEVGPVDVGRTGRASASWGPCSSVWSSGRCGSSWATGGLARRVGRCGEVGWSLGWYFRRVVAPPSTRLPKVVSPPDPEPGQLRCRLAHDRLEAGEDAEPQRQRGDTADERPSAS